MTVRKQTLAELDGMPESLRSSVLAASAVKLSALLDRATPREAPALARELRITMDQLRDLARAASVEVDPIDELAKRRDARHSGPEVSARAAGGDDGD